MKLAISKITVAAFLTLTFVCVVNAQGRTATIISTSANLRETPSQNGRVKQEVPLGSEVRVLDSKGAWYVVRIADAVGWMYGNTFRFGTVSTSDRTQSDSLTDTTENSSSRPARVRTDSRPAGVSSSSSGRGYIRGPRGGCYYFSGSGRKVYVDRSLCN
jgi:hypothetical protein